MPSSAHGAWTGTQRARLGELDAAHSTALRDGQATEQLLWSLTLRLAAEFQDYARNLHTLAADELVTVCAPTNTGLANILRDNFAAKRDLEVANARVESITKDYQRLGFHIWDALQAVHGKQVDTWKSTLTDLNITRNALAHNDPPKLAKLHQQGIMPLSLQTLTQWRQDIDLLVDAMDSVVGDYVSRLLGINPPW